MIDSELFEQQTWKLPEERNESMMRQLEIPVFNGENAEN